MQLLFRSVTAHRLPFVVVGGGGGGGGSGGGGGRTENSDRGGVGGEVVRGGRGYK